jgi:release factor glutamine methyltransferase
MARTLHEHIAGARAALAAAGLSPDKAAIDADVLARHVLGWDRATLLTRGGEEAAPDFVVRYEAAVRRRAAREPVALITGHREFWGLDFEVTRDVLVPRPETELIVEAALARLDRRSPIRILDVGTGSGCLAVALATEFPAARVTATDISPGALRVAARNAERLAARRVRLVRAYLVDGLRGPFDLIVSNPPYVPAGAALSVDVARYEPPTALYADEDGLGLLRVLIATAPVALAEGGALIVEFGYGQAEHIQELANQAGWRDVQLEEDLQGIPRIAVMSGRSH